MHNFSTIVPADLRSVPQWVCWKYVDRAGKRTKVPVNPRFGWNASATDPSTWATFEEAQSAYERSDTLAGVGFVFTEDDPFAGLDFDDCVDEHGNLLWGNELLAEFDTYAEVSPSGTGLKLFLRGRKPDWARCKQGGFGPDGNGSIEVYDRARWFAVTGDVWPGTPTTVEDRQEQLDALCGRLWPQKTRLATQERRPEPPSPEPAKPRKRAVRACLDAVLKMNIDDHADGSKRLYATACRCVEHDLTDTEAIEVVLEYESLRPFPKPWSMGEIIRRVRDAERQCNRGVAKPDEPFRPNPLSTRQLLDGYPELRHPVLHGLLRRGETMNLIAATKIGKTWLVTDLAHAIATGGLWLGSFEAEAGDVLVIDNELHRETTANRIPKVAAARNQGLGEIGDRVFYEHLRGRLRNIHEFAPYFESLEPGRFRAVVIDALYRCMPAGIDENDNAAMAGVFNTIDRFADRLGCAVVLVHHASKGNQSGKSITDVGAGAGSQSRAVDTHVVLRPHEEPDCAVLDAAVRSWPPIEPRVYRWTFPVWTPDDSLDPTRLLSPRRSRRKSADGEPAEPEWDAERFARSFVGVEPRTLKEITEEAKEAGVSRRRVREFLKLAEDKRMVESQREAVNKPIEYLLADCRTRLDADRDEQVLRARHEAGDLLLAPADLLREPVPPHLDRVGVLAEDDVELVHRLLEVRGRLDGERQRTRGEGADAEQPCSRSFPSSQSTNCSGCIALSSTRRHS